MLSESRKSILKFEDMLKTNTNYYFDSTEFINITHHYIDNANFSLAEKAISMGLEPVSYTHLTLPTNREV